MSSFAEIRKEVWLANVQLPKAGLVTMHSGNASGIHRESGLVLIKPSGIDYDKLKPEDLAVVDLEGNRPAASKVPDGVCSSMKPSVDTVHHLLLYKKDPSLGGVIHTHSNYATAWAAMGLSIPCAITAMADEFGGNIPCTPYVDNQGENIANAIITYRHRGPAVLMGGHGVFTFDKTPSKALKAAIMVEDVAKTMWLARQLGPARPLPATEIEKWWGRYHSTYGQ
jgi:L-ribulose-5-phosphate 4-epimerase